MSVPLVPADERTFVACFRRMQAARKAMPQPTDFIRRPRRKSGIIGIDPLPSLPLVEQPIKPLSILTIDSDLEEPEAVALEPEVGFVPALVAGEDEPEIPNETDEDSEPDEPGDSQDEVGVE
jgi:hypothetical protein